MFFQEAIDDTYQTLNEKYVLYQNYEKLLNKWLDSREMKITSMQRFCFTFMLQSDLFGESTAGVEEVAYMMECSTRTARKVLADVGNLVTFSKDGHKQIWHINLKELAKLET